MRESLQEYCLRSGSESLLLQWHPQKNGALTPDQVSYGSQRKLWWHCEQGHEWQSPPYARVGKGSGCPYCSGKLVAPGQDLQSLHPTIAAQWHPTKNGDATPQQVRPGSRKSVWWCCEQGHAWKSMVKSRVAGNGCPVCANRVVISGRNDLGSTAPMIAAQWHPTKNGSLTPQQFSAGSEQKVWWRCQRGHEWQARIHSRAAGKGCPVCTGKQVLPGENDLQSFAPALAQQWHPEKNQPLRPDQLSPGSNRRVWWRCELGHEWQASVASRAAGQSSCPYCTGRKVLPGFNDLQTVQPLIAAQWHPTRNEPLQPTMVSAGSSKKVWWRCHEGHEWKAVVYSRTGGRQSGCPVCAGKTPPR